VSLDRFYRLGMARFYLYVVPQDSIDLEWRDSIYMCDIPLPAMLAVSRFFGALSLDLERREQADGMQRSGQYCKDA